MIYDKNPLLDRVTRMLMSGEVSEAVAVLRDAADGGNAAAMRMLGDMYRKGAYGIGPDVVPDSRQAISWFERAIAAGDAESMVELSRHYCNGDGVDVDVKRAMELCERAGEAGCGRGFFILAQFSEFGDHGVMEDLVRAVGYYRLALRNDFSCAGAHLGRLHLEGKGVNRDFVEGLALLEKAVAADNPEGMMLLGEVMEKGLFDEETNPGRALKLYRQAARLGHNPARFAIRRFPAIVKLGQVSCSPAIASLPQEDLSELVKRQAHGQWCDYDPEAWDANDAALAGGERVVSIHPGVPFVVTIQTEADRRNTFITTIDEDYNLSIDIPLAMKRLWKLAKFYKKGFDILNGR